MMFATFVSAIFGVGIGLALAIPSARAADEIEAKAQPCAACHGASGVPTDPKTIPVIWGQEQSYLMKQLRDFRNGERNSAVMSPIAKELPDGDLRKIAAYFSAKTWPARPAPAKQPLPPKSIVQCQACHQPNFQGGMPAPRLAGLGYEYLVAAMRAFATEERTNNLDMPKFMQALTDRERSAIARYLSAR
ncbi:MAG TPA: c-type cytochrome [Burkholderiales bacterium]|nr:c-type cytochrome [Burkholderiales bacterium]